MRSLAYEYKDVLEFVESAGANGGYIDQKIKLGLKIAFLTVGAALVMIY
jgi:hypothetical protein